MEINTIVWLLIIGLLGGILSGFMGVGGGIIIVPMLALVLGMSQHEAQGTYLGMMIAPLAAFSAYNYWKAGHLNWKYALILMATFAIGSFLGSYIANYYISGKTLRKLFGIVMLLTSLKICLANSHE